MAQSDRQGTGRHPHKDTQEPWPHTKENEREGAQHSRTAQTHGPSHDGRSDRSSHNAPSHGGSSSHSGSSQAEHRGSSSENSDLKQREYRDEKGEVHHHTRTYMEEHKGERTK